MAKTRSVIGPQSPEYPQTQSALSIQSITGLQINPYSALDNSGPGPTYVNRWAVTAHNDTVVGVVVATFATREEAVEYITSDPDGLL